MMERRLFHSTIVDPDGFSTHSPASVDASQHAPVLPPGVSHSFVVDGAVQMPQRKMDWKRLVTGEALSTILWAVLIVFLQQAPRVFQKSVTYDDGINEDCLFFWNAQTTVWENLQSATRCVLHDWIRRDGNSNNSSVALASVLWHSSWFRSTLLVFFLRKVQAITGVLPALSYRIALSHLKRLTRLEVAVSVLVHCACVFAVLRIAAVLFDDNETYAAFNLFSLTPGADASSVDSATTTLGQTGRLVLGTMLLTVGCHVVPVLLQLNRYSDGWTAVLLGLVLALCNNKDTCGPMQSPLTFLMTISFQCLGTAASTWEDHADCARQVQTVLLHQVLPYLVGAIWAGRILARAFPDDPKV